MGEDTAHSDGGPTPEQREMAIAATARRTQDPLRNWTPPAREECPICHLPYPMEKNMINRFTFWGCCGKKSCKGCIFSQAGAIIKDKVDNIKRGIIQSQQEMEDTLLKVISKCPFCGENGHQDPNDQRSIFPSANDDEEEGVDLGRLLMLVEGGNPDATFCVAKYRFHGGTELPQDKKQGLELYHTAVSLGSPFAAAALGRCFLDGDAVERDHNKTVEYYFRAAELGFVEMYFFIGEIYLNCGEVEEAMMNFRRAAICGFSEDVVFDSLRDGFRNGYITKDEYAYTLRENQKAANAMKSEAREMAKHVSKLDFDSVKRDFHSLREGFLTKDEYAYALTGNQNSANALRRSLDEFLSNSGL